MPQFMSLFQSFIIEAALCLKQIVHVFTDARGGRVDDRCVAKHPFFLACGMFPYLAGMGIDAMEQLVMGIRKTIKRQGEIVTHEIFNNTVRHAVGLLRMVPMVGFIMTMMVMMAVVLVNLFLDTIEGPFPLDVALDGGQQKFRRFEVYH
jgi:hypothetical protein